MARNSSGVYTLPQAAFTPGTTISSSAVNSDFSDIATALTQSLATTGVSTMSAPLKGFGGTVASPGYTFATDATTGFWLVSAGNMGLALAGVQAAAFNSSLAVTWYGAQTAPAFTLTSGISIPAPIGAIIDFAGSSAPTGWLLCYGQSLSTTTYAALFAVIGTTYGTGGAGTFNVPDLRGRTGFGQDNMGGVAANRITAAFNFDGTVLGNAGGQQSRAIQPGNIPNYALSVTDPGHSHTYTNAAAGGAVFLQSGLQTGGSGSTGTSTTGITVNSGGGGINLPVLSPAVIFNKIIYAGQ